MSEEEKKAIEILKDRESDFDILYETFRQSFVKPYDKSISIILNLIDKQQKEIKELKNKLENVAKIRKCFIEIYNDKDNEEDI